MRVGVDEAQAVVEKGELPAGGLGDGGGLYDGFGRGQGRDRFGEALAGDVEHVDGDVEAGKGRDAAAGGAGLCFRGIAIGIIVRSVRQRRPVVVLEVPARPHRQLQHVAARVLRQPAPQLGDAHPPLGQVELLVKLLGVVARQRRRPPRRRRVLAVAACTGPRRGGLA